MTAKLVLKRDQLAKIRRWKGIKTDAELALLIGINAGNLSRILRGDQQPGPKFIAALCHALDADLNDLFEVTFDDVKAVS